MQHFLPQLCGMRLQLQQSDRMQANRALQLLLLLQREDGEGGCPENSAAVQFKSIGNSSSSMHESATNAREHFDMIKLRFKVDVDKNGSISLNEAINYLGLKLENGTSDSAVNTSWFAEIDRNDNKQIDPGEFDPRLGATEQRQGRGGNVYQPPAPLLAGAHEIFRRSVNDPDKFGRCVAEQLNFEQFSERGLAPEACTACRLITKTA
ncbi:hypothetical protein GPALN_010363 [Globodera pallida]|nr:hypothetical protein GPALN_010363 [Globodera pallida]